MNKANMEEIFDHILTRKNVKENKPNPEMYKEAVRVSGRTKQEIIALEDELVGIKATIGAGIQVISMYDKYSDIDRQLINATADYSFDDYKTLTKKLK